MYILKQKISDIKKNEVKTKIFITPKPVCLFVLFTLLNILGMVQHVIDLRKGTNSIGKICNIYGVL